MSNRFNIWFSSLAIIFSVIGVIQNAHAIAIMEQGESGEIGGATPQTLEYTCTAKSHPVGGVWLSASAAGSVTLSPCSVDGISNCYSFSGGPALMNYNGLRMYGFFYFDKGRDLIRIHYNRVALYRGSTWVGGVQNAPDNSGPAAHGYTYVKYGDPIHLEFWAGDAGAGISEFNFVSCDFIPHMA